MIFSKSEKAPTLFNKKAIPGDVGGDMAEIEVIAEAAAGGYKGDVTSDTADIQTGASFGLSR